MRTIPMLLVWRKVLPMMPLGLLCLGLVLLLGFGASFVSFVPPAEAQSPVPTLSPNMVIKVSSITHNSAKVTISNLPVDRFKSLELFVNINHPGGFKVEMRYSYGETSGTRERTISLKPNTNYYVYARIFDQDLNRLANSNRVTFTTQAGTPSPNAPTGLQTSGITSNSVTLSWKASTGGPVTHYEVKHAGMTQWVDSGSDLTHTFTGLSINTRYLFSVRAVGDGGTSGVASTTATTKVVAPNAPTGLTTSGITTSAITLTWTASTGGAVTRYEVSTDGKYLGGFGERPDAHLQQPEC